MNILETFMGVFTSIQFVIETMNSLIIISSDGITISLGDVIEYSMIITIVLWIIGGMIRHNGNS